MSREDLHEAAARVLRDYAEEDVAMSDVGLGGLIFLYVDLVAAVALRMGVLPSQVRELIDDEDWPKELVL